MSLMDLIGQTFEPGVAPVFVPGIIKLDGDSDDEPTTTIIC